MVCFRCCLQQRMASGGGLPLNLAPLDDPALLGLIATGRTEALSELYDRYGRLVYTVAFHIVNNPETAEEITQDVFLKLFASCGKDPFSIYCFYCVSYAFIYDQI